mmetsp:Transcript_29778/g.68332  ORF Transcript_29778/g.68332 Transcript_29778/m.68332 type:complete len:245 (+) Transcript_29778:392-1126(+)
MPVATAVTLGSLSLSALLAIVTIRSFCGSRASSICCLSLGPFRTPSTRSAVCSARRARMPSPAARTGCLCLNASCTPSLRPMTVRSARCARMPSPATRTRQYLLSSAAVAAASTRGARTARRETKSMGANMARRPQAAAALSRMVQAVAALCIFLVRRGTRKERLAWWSWRSGGEASISISSPKPVQKAAERQSMARAMMTGSWHCVLLSAKLPPTFGVWERMTSVSFGAKVAYTNFPYVAISV